MYLNNWKSLEDLQADFWPEYAHSCAKKLEGVNILLASYGTPSCEGYAFVLFKKDGKLYEINASHCSCFGLERQWCPEETTIEALKYRVEKGTLGHGDWEKNPFKKELLQILVKELL